MANLLDEASILLTPTASDDGKLLSVIPSEAPYGDFEFDRNSSATRVNAQGLVEDVQILSGDLVQNGDFSEIGTEDVLNGDFSEEGAEEVLNGDFSNGSTDWTLGTGWSIGEDKATFDETIGGAGDIVQNSILTSGKSYKLTFDTLETNGGNLAYKLGGGYTFISNIQANTTHTVYGVAGGSQFALRGASDFIGSITNISVKEVGQNWIFSSGAFLTDIGARLTHTPTAGILTSVGYSPLVIGNNYKMTYEITQSISGGIKINSAVDVDMVSTVGVHTKYFEADSPMISLARTDPSGNDVTIDNISIKEVAQNWSLGDGWEVGVNEVVCDGTQTAATNLQQTITTNIQNQLVRVSFTLDYTAGLLLGSLSGTGGVDFTNITSSGTYTAEMTSNEVSPILTLQGDASFIGSITNVIIKSVTNDTNLPRINYEGFSYQDALGSELVTGGNFSNPSDWGLAGGSPPTITNNKLNLIGDTYNSIASNVGASLVSGKTYKVSFEITDYTSGGATFRLGGVFGVSKSGLGVHTQYIVSDGAAIRLYSSQNGTDLSLTNVSVKEYLGQEVVPNSGCGSWLFEPQSTNLIPYSEDFSSLNIRDNAVVTSNQIIAPSGLLDADEITFDGTLYGRVEASVSTIVGQPYTISLYLKNKNLSNVTQVWIGFSAASQGEFVTITDEWQRYDITTNADGTTEYPRIQFSGTGSLYAWGFQTEQQSHATSYIPTEGTTKTRNGEGSRSTGDVSSLINSTEGVLYAEIAKNALTNDNLIAISLSDGTTTNRVMLSYTTNSTNIKAQIRTGNIDVFDQSFGLGAQALNFNKVAISYKANQFKFFVNGTKVAEGTSGATPIGLIGISFNEGVNVNRFFGKTKCLAVWKTALSEQELIDLTS